MRSWVGKVAIICICAASLAGCGGGSKANNTVTQVTLNPASLSLVSGETGQLSAAALNSANSSVIATVTFTSSNPNLVTVSTSGLVCAGVWDASFVVCKGTDSGGNPLTGSATITATANGVNSTPITVSVHLQVSSIVAEQASPTSACTSIKQTQQYKATACSSLATPHDSSGPCAPNAKDITSQVGTFTWTSSNGTVGTVDANGLVTASAPGLMGVIARLGNVSSPAANFRSCMPVQITLHLNGDPAGSPTTSASLNVTQTRTLQADMTDEANVTTNSVPVAVVSNDNQIGTVSSLTLTGATPGGAGILAACIPPVCGTGVNLPIYSNLFQVTVNGTSPNTTVYASSTWAPPSGVSPTLVPIDTSNNTAGTAINLPGVPNSLVFTTNGIKGYLGTNAGLVSLDTGSNTATLVSGNKGKVLAVSPDGNTVIFSNAASAPDPVTGVVGPIDPVVGNQRLVVFTANNNTIQSFVLPGAVAAAFTGNSFKAYIAASNGNVYVYSPVLSLQTLSLGGANNDVTTLASGPFAYLVNGANLQVLGTCNNVLQGTTPGATSTPHLVGSFGNANTIVAVNDTGLDITTATVTALGAPVVITPANCTPNVSYSSPQFIDFGIGAFTARQLLVPTDGVGNNGDPNNGTHIVVLPVGINKVLTAIQGAGPTNITLPAGATEALSGSLTLDGNTAWVGVGGKNTVDKIDLVGAADVAQVATSFKKQDSTAAPPNIVTVKPK
ncbi:MAG TPA: Ig-like domain-containing protein [Candidatus Angelobacter sp.]|nr:Ig-like domain-containing protein [Candidatus Angelobacter sp.]